MTKKLLLFLVAVLPLTLSAARLTFYPGIIHFRNGESVEYSGIAIPGPGASAIVVSNDPKHKEREKLPTEDIFSIALWHENHPDNVGYLYPLQVEVGSGTQTRICLLECSSSWCAVLQMGDYYAINSSNGELYGIVTGINGTAPTVRHYLLKSGEDKAVLLFTNQSWNPRRSQAAQHFAENPEVADGITSGNLKTTDIAYILDAMAAGEGAIATSADHGDDEDATQAPATHKAAASKHNTRKNTTYGIDNAYQMTNAVRISYTNFLSPDQLVEGVYSRAIKYAVGEVHIGGRWEQVKELQYPDDESGDTPPDTITQTKASLFLGVTLGGQLPIQLGKYYLIPRITAGMMLSPFSFASKRNSMLFAVPLTAGVEFAFPVSADYALNIGVHYTYDFHFYRKNFDEKIRQTGQNGLGASIAFCW